MSFYKTIFFYVSFFILGFLLMGIFFWFKKDVAVSLPEKSIETEVKTFDEVLTSLTSQASSSLSKQEEVDALNFLSSTSSTSTKTNNNGSIDINSLEAR